MLLRNSRAFDLGSPRQKGCNWRLCLTFAKGKYPRQPFGGRPGSLGLRSYALAIARWIGGRAAAFHVKPIGSGHIAD